METSAPIEPRLKSGVGLRWLAPVAWGALIFWASHQPSLGLELPFPHFDKLLHFGTYTVLGTLIRFALGTRGPRDFLIAWMLGTLYGLSDEFHQAFVPGRDADLLDWAADCFGALVGAYWGIRLLGRSKGDEVRV